MTRPPFAVDAFLAQPLTARVAASGPTVRPTWYLWEDEAFWILTGPWATLPARVRTDPAIAIVVDVCDLATGLVRQVIARGRAELLPFDVARGRRKLSRYLGHKDKPGHPTQFGEEGSSTVRRPAPSSAAPSTACPSPRRWSAGGHAGL